MVWPKESDRTSRNAMHLSCDKMVYHPADTVYFTLFCVDALSHKAPADITPANVIPTAIKIMDPKGSVTDTIYTTMLPDAPAIGSCSWTIPEDPVGGVYKATLVASWENRSSSSGAPDLANEALTLREFEIRTYRPPKLAMVLELMRKGGYSPGEKNCKAMFSCKRVEGGLPPSGTPVSATIAFPGSPSASWKGALDNAGECVVPFDVPQTANDDGTVTVTVTDGGTVDSKTRTVPVIVPASITVDFFPESGDVLLPGVPCRVYFEAKNKLGDPVDIKGTVNDKATGKIVCPVQAIHEGRGAFEICASAGVSYEVRLTSPPGLTFALPLAQPDGVILRALKTIYRVSDPVEVAVVAAGTYVGKSALVQVSLREKLLCEEKVKSVGAEWAHVQLKIPADTPGGALRVTVVVDNLPVSERLVFVSPSTSIELKVTADKDVFAPGSPVKLKVTAVDGTTKKPVVGAWLNVVVSDSSVCSVIERRKRRPMLPAMMLLEHEVQHLEDSDAYGMPCPNSIKQNTALDLLLGTQGWRRFAYYNLEKFVEKFGDKARSALEWDENGVACPDDLYSYSEEECDEECCFECDDADCPPVMEEKMIMKEAPARKEMAIPALCPPALAAPKPLAALRALAPPPPPPQALAPPPPPQKAAAPAPQVLAHVALPQQQQQQHFEKEAMPEMDECECEEEWYEDEYRPQRLAKPIVFVREFAYAPGPNHVEGIRTDFLETVFWTAGATTDQSGEVSLQFHTSDLVTSFSVSVNALTKDGLVGATAVVDPPSIECRPLFYINVKIPSAVTVGDVILIPLVLVNDSDKKKIATSLLSAKGIKLPQELFSKETALPPKSRVREIIQGTVVGPVGEGSLEIKSTVGLVSDSAKFTLLIQQKGFPIAVDVAGTLTGEMAEEFTLDIPLDATTKEFDAKVFPSPSSNLTSAVSGLISEPSGCFEQTSCTVYPMVMAMQYFASKGNVGPDGKELPILARARACLESGYKRLVSYECKDGGFEWFGSSPGHEALTAYGLLEFVDMMQVFPVDQKMITRTFEWLFGQRLESGGFKRNSLALDSFGGAPDGITNAYIMWSLSYADMAQGLERQLEHVCSLVSLEEKKDGQKDDPYLVALVSGTLANIGRTQDARKLAKRLVPFQNKDGAVANASTSITRSSGQCLMIETTAISILAWLPFREEFVENLQVAIKWLNSQCRNGRFGSTQGTVLALKAIMAYDTIVAQTAPRFDLVLSIDGKDLETLEISSSSVGEPPKFKPIAEDLLSAGKHSVSLRILGDVGSLKLPFTCRLKYYTVKPQNPPTIPLELKVSPLPQTIEEGQNVSITCTVHNHSDQGEGMVVAVIGLPGGLTARADRLKELVTSKAIAFYETSPRNVVLYWRGIGPQQQLSVTFDADATAVGTYTGEASRGYLYYADASLRHWLDPLTLSITPKK